jgi:hypothetical protein
VLETDFAFLILFVDRPGWTIKRAALIEAFRKGGAERGHAPWSQRGESGETIATQESGNVQVFGRRHDEPFHALWRPASKKRQGTKSRKVGYRRGSGRYGDLMAAPNWRVDVAAGGYGRRIGTLARLEACNRHLGKRSERINERTQGNRARERSRQIMT